MYSQQKNFFLAFIPSKLNMYYIDLSLYVLPLPNPPQNKIPHQPFMMNVVYLHMSFSLYFLYEGIF